MRCVVARPMGCQAVLLPRGHSGRRVPVGRQKEGLRQWVQVRGPPEGTPELGWPPKLCPPCWEVGQNEGHSERPRGLPQQDGPCTPRARAGARGLLVQKRWRVPTDAAEQHPALQHGPQAPDAGRPTALRSGSRHRHSRGPTSWGCRPGQPHVRGHQSDGGAARTPRVHPPGDGLAGFQLSALNQKVTSLAGCPPGESLLPKEGQAAAGGGTVPLLTTPAVSQQPDPTSCEALGAELGRPPGQGLLLAATSWCPEAREWWPKSGLCLALTWGSAKG